jgi:hypothetical protein
MRHVWTVLMVFVVLAGSAGAQQPESLADVARREADRRRAVKSTGRVYTNADVRKATPLTVAAQPQPAAGKTGAEPEQPKDKPGQAAEVERKDETYWRKRMTDLQGQLTRSRLFAEALQSRVNGLWADFTARDDPAQRAIIEANRNEALAELDRVKGEVTQLERQISDLEEEARKAGVPPGWLR